MKKAMKLAIQKMQSAMVAHPNAKPVLIAEGIEALEEALAKQEQGEPVAWELGAEVYWNDSPALSDYIRKEGTPLYTHPQPKEEQDDHDDLTIAYMSGLHRGKELSAQPKREPLTDEQMDKAAMKLAQCMDYPWAHMPEEGKREMRDHAKAIIEAVDGIAPQGSDK